MNKSGKIQPNRKVKDSVFTDLFSIPENLLELYKALHPDDLNATIDDLDLVSIENVLTVGLYNDLGFIVGNRLMILVEAQTVWSVNILIRGFLYFAETLNRYINEMDFDMHRIEQIRFPKPELYVIYTGDKKLEKKVYSWSEDFFDGEMLDLDVRMNVLTLDGIPKNIIEQYIGFCKTLNKQRSLYPNDARKSIEETIRICMDSNVLKEYLKGRLKEVMDIMYTLYNEENIQRRSLATAEKKGIAIGHEQGLEQGLEQGKESQAHAIALSLYSSGMAPEEISRHVGFSLDTVKRWIEENHH